MKKFLLLSILCYTYTVYAQHYIPVKKMISNYKEQKAIDALKNYDIVYNIEESPEAGVFMENLYYHPIYQDLKIFVQNGVLNILQDKRLCYT